MAQQLNPQQIREQQFLIVWKIVRLWLGNRLYVDGCRKATEKNLAACSRKFVNSLPDSKPEEIIKFLQEIHRKASKTRNLWDTAKLKVHLEACSVKPNVDKAHIYAYRHWLYRAMDVIKHANEFFPIFYQMLEWLLAAVKGFFLGCASPEEGLKQANDLCGLVSEVVVGYKISHNQTILHWLTTWAVTKDLFKPQQLARPSEVQPPIPPRERPTTPPRDRPTTSPREKLAKPPRDRPTTPQREKPTTPPREKPSTPPREKPTTPPRDRPTTPPRDRPTTPPSEKPTTPPRDRPTTPPSEKPTTPPRDRPTTPPREEPSTPPKEKPITPPQEQPATPPREKPTTPPREKPTTPPRDRPTTLQREKPTTPPSGITQPIQTVVQPIEAPDVEPAEVVRHLEPADNSDSDDSLKSLIEYLVEQHNRVHP